MIKINLLGEDTRIDHTGLLVLIGFAASLVLLIVVFFFMQQSITADIIKMSDKKGELEAELARWQKETKAVKDLEKKKKDLKLKLAVIARLKRSKIGPVRVLDDLNMALPERSWLTRIDAKSDRLQIKGLALDNQTIALFMKELEASDYFNNVDLVETKLVDRKGVKMNNFTVSTRVNYAGKIEIKKPKEKKKKRKA
ncbi:MAG: hypothetical protein D6719_01285 [Candidatus Dadabacteria bacterium]|nr:MAG: hypothetical protein D6719_01285 [Candidatus Dadabacteria bacterium]